MAEIHPVSLSKLNHIAQSFNVLGGLQPGERLWTCGNYITKSGAPGGIVKGSNNQLQVTLRRITTIAQKLIQVLGRLLTGQKVGKNLAKAEALNTRLLQELQGALPPAEGKRFYQTLNQLGVIQRSLMLAQEQGLKHLKRTYESGLASLHCEPASVRAVRGERVAALIGTLNETTAPLLAAKIEAMTDMVAATDQKLVTDLLDKLVSKDKIDRHEICGKFVTVAALKQVLSLRYGSGAVDRALTYYGLDKVLAIPAEDILAVIVGAAANLTYADLAEIYANDPKAKGAFADLDEQQKCHYLFKLREIDFDAAVPLHGKKYCRQLKHDQNVLLYLSRFEEFNIHCGAKHPAHDVKKFSHAEFLARHLCYALFDQHMGRFPDGILTPYYDQKGVLRLKAAHTLISEEGINGILVRPAYCEPGQKKVHADIAFRGTYCKDSIYRDINPFETVNAHLFDGPGRWSFELRKEVISDRIFAHLQTLASDSEAENIRLSFCGHSLGGSDAQREMEYFSHLLTEKENHNISGINLYAFNSPNVESDIAKRFIGSVNALQMPFKLRYLDVQHDFVQELGTKRLGYCGLKVDKPENLHVTIVKFNRRLEERVKALAKNIFFRTRYHMAKAYEAHTYYCLSLHDSLDEQRKNKTFVDELYSNYPKDQKMRFGKKLEETAHFLDDEALDNRLLTKAGKVGRKIKRLTQGILKTITFGYFRPDLVAS